MSDRETRSTDVSAMVRKRLRLLRYAGGYRTAADLAAACRERGAPWITANVIENLEGNRRNRAVTVDELLVFAAVFGVAPAAILPPSTDAPPPLRGQRCPATYRNEIPHSLVSFGVQCKYTHGHGGYHAGDGGTGQGDVFWP